MMNCAECQKRIAAYVDAELPPAEMEAVRSHAQTCAGCASSALASLERKLAIRRAGLRYSPPPELRARVFGLCRAKAEVIDRKPVMRSARAWLPQRKGSAPSEAGRRLPSTESKCEAGCAARDVLGQAFRRLCHTVGIVPPSMTYSLPVMEEARSDARNATSSVASGMISRSGIACGVAEYDLRLAPYEDWTLQTAATIAKRAGHPNLKFQHINAGLLERVRKHRFEHWRIAGSHRKFRTKICRRHS